VLQADGSLKCAWYHPDGFDTITQTMKLTPPNTALAKTFRAVRGIHAGSVRVTANGAIITSWQHHGEWRCHYLGHLDASQWPHLEEWIEPRTGVAREGNAPDVPANAQPTVASARTEDDDSDNGEESSIDYPLDPTEALFEDWFAPPEIEEEEEEEEETEEAEEETEEDAETEAEDIDTVDVGDAGLHQATFSEQHKLLSCIDSHGGDLAKAPATSQRQYATAQVKRQPTPTRLWNWVVSKLKGQS
jgi:hypothetical protein